MQNSFLPNRCQGQHRHIRFGAAIKNTRLPVFAPMQNSQVALSAVIEGMSTLSRVVFVLFLSCCYSCAVNQLPFAGCPECRQKGHGYAELCWVCAVP
jgi:hypothetical protein